MTAVLAPDVLEHRDWIEGQGVTVSHRLPGHRAGDGVRRLGARAPALDPARVGIDDPVLGNARGLVPAALEATVGMGRAWRDHLDGEQQAAQYQFTDTMLADERVEQAHEGQHRPLMRAPRRRGHQQHPVHCFVPPPVVGQRAHPLRGPALSRLRHTHNARLGKRKSQWGIVHHCKGPLGSDNPFHASSGRSCPRRGLSPRFPPAPAPPLPASSAGPRPRPGWRTRAG